MSREVRVVSTCSAVTAAPHSWQIHRSGIQRIRKACVQFGAGSCIRWSARR